MDYAYKDGFQQENGIRPSPKNFKQGRSVRLIIAIIFFMGLFAFLHFREVRIEVLELNSTAERYVVAQVDFDFFDEEATRRLKREAERDIDRIYKTSEKEVRERRSEFEDFLLHNEEWRKIVKHATFNEMMQAVDVLYETMTKSRFTDARTLQKMKEMQFPVANYEVFTPEDDSQLVSFPQKVWRNIEKMSYADQLLHRDTEEFVLNYFKKKNWRLEEDYHAMRMLERVIMNTIPDKYTHMSAGDRIIDQGDKVTTRHVAMFQAMKESLTDKRNLWHPLTLIGTFILTLTLTVIAYIYCRMNFFPTISSNRNLALLVSVVLLTLLIAKITEYIILKNPNNLIESVRYPIFAPFACILLCILLNMRVSIFVGGFLAVVLSMTLAVERNGFMIINLLAAFASVLSLKSLRKRKEVFIVCAKAWIICILIILGLNLYDNTLAIVSDLTSALLSMAVTAILVVGFLPLFESVFSIMTDVTLMEFMDPNHELLRRLSIEAPGTYQHSIVVGNIAETAAIAIGANGLFCRVSCLYHDIGKLITPHYFTENQQGGINMHHLLTPLESAQVIIAHVVEGVTLAYKAHLPEPFIDIIKEHHGNTLVYYFYRKQCELMGGDKALVDEDDFKYPGPRPRSKESAIIMIADSLEAASRSLDELSEKTVTELVESIVNEKAETGQFDHCKLTFEELGIVKKEMIKTLVAAGHSRIKYPKKEEGLVVVS